MLRIMMCLLHMKKEKFRNNNKCCIHFLLCSGKLIDAKYIYSNLDLIFSVVGCLCVDSEFKNKT